MTDIAQIIAAAAQRHGQNPDTLMKIAQIESGLNPSAKNPRSSAGGLFQFIDSTAKQVGLQNRFDPMQAAEAGARLTQQNASLLSSRLGRQPTPGELYLAHQQGAGGALKILSNPNAAADSLVGGDAVRLNGGKPGMTAQQFASLWTSKLDGTKVAPTSQDFAAPAADMQGVGDLVAGNAGFVAPPQDFGDLTLQALAQSQARQQQEAEVAQADQTRRAALFSGLGRSFG